MDNTTIKVPESFANAIRANCTARPCSFDPISFAEGSPADPQSGMPAKAFITSGVKRMWFYDHCAKKEVVGRIITPEVELKFDVNTPDGGTIGFAVAKAEVWMGDACVGTAQAGQAFYLTMPDLDNIIQTVQGIAVSRALTNAGFGCVSGSDICEDAPTNTAQPNMASAENGELPFKHPDDPPEGGPGANTPPAAASGGALTYEAAKAVICPMKGMDCGKTLGVLLATKPSTVEYLAVKWRGDPQVREAALLLLPEALRAKGKPVPANLT